MKIYIVALRCERLSLSPTFLYINLLSKRVSKHWHDWLSLCWTSKPILILATWFSHSLSPISANQALTFGLLLTCHEHIYCRAASAIFSSVKSQTSKRLWVSFPLLVSKTDRRIGYASLFLYLILYLRNLHTRNGCLFCSRPIMIYISSRCAVSAWFSRQYVDISTFFSKHNWHSQMSFFLSSGLQILVTDNT